MTLRHALLGALAAGLTFGVSAALAATVPACSHLRTEAPPSNPKDVFRTVPACSHLRTEAPPSNPKDVFRTAVRMCDMPADCGMMPRKAGAAQPAASLQG